MAAFRKQGSVAENSAPALRRQIIANTTTVTNLASVKLSSGFIALGTTGALVYGHVYDIETAKGLGLLTTGAAGAAVGSYVGTFATASDNQTVAKVRAICDVSKDTLYSASADATLGGTTGSNLAGYTMDLADSTQLSETSAVATTGQYMSEGLDPADSTRVIVHIFESQFSGV